jgi:predicted TIM-barrel fold metal-dependent hydrolase
MLSRRNLLFGVAAATAATFRRRADLHAAASQPSTPVNFAVPPGATDCHTHIFGDVKRFPFWEGRGYTPEPASLEELRAMHRAVHIERTICVHGLPYGPDLSITLDELPQLGPQARAIAVIEDSISDTQLDALNRAGFRGIRHNILSAGQPDPAYARKRLQFMGKKLEGRGWCLEVSSRLSMTDELFDDYMAVPMPIVFSHFGGAQAAAGLQQPGLQSLLRLLQAGKGYVKLSAVYRAGKHAPDYADAGPLAQAFVAANPDRVLYGSDWPHPLGVPPPGGTKYDIARFVPVDDGLVVNQLAVWFPDAAVRKKILVDNPARLYGFSGS